jgi:uncharacterized protein
MMHPNTELRYINDNIGYGIFAKTFIPKGTFLWVLDELDKILSPDTVRNLPELLRSSVEKYAYVDCQGDYVLCWDFGRYTNHSCHPTMRSLGQSVEVAVRDIAAGEELTCEYGVLNLSGSFKCACGKPNCRQTVTANDLDAYWQDWDAEVNALVAVIPDVPQPLRPFIKANSTDKGLLEAIFNRHPVYVPSHVLYKAEASAMRQEDRPGDTLWKVRHS